MIIQYYGSYLSNLKQKVEAASVLVNFGADVHAHTDGGVTPLDLALEISPEVAYELEQISFMPYIER